MKYAKPFGMVRGYADKDCDWKEGLCADDIITLHVPLNEETKGMIGEKEIAMMKDGALLVNTSRPQIVDEEAVIEALKSGKLAGYAHDFKPQVHIDTTERWNLWMNSGVNDKVIATPHIGGKCREAREITDKYIAEKIIEFIGAS
jgi:D-3-phosphoglycerate dehydrogenase